MIVQMNSTFVFPMSLMDVNGNVTVLTDITAVQWRLMGPNGAIIDWATGNVALAANGVLITIAPLGNIITSTEAVSGLAVPASTEGRLVQLRLSATSPIIFSGDYIVSIYSGGIALDVMVNSFQTYPSALKVAAGITSIDSWVSAAYDDRVVAMSTAYYFLTRLNYEINFASDSTYYKRFAGYGMPGQTTLGSLIDYSAADLEKLDQDFLKAIRMAQVVEADQRLGGGNIQKEREVGLESRSVGDASHKFRTSLPLQLGVSHETLKYLKGYVKYAPRVARV